MTSAPTPVSQGRDPELARQTVVVIGGSAGIELATASRAQAEGTDAILTGRHPGRLKQPARELGAPGTAGGAATTCHP
jgi:NADP-dependent 3-hydroxy acid dehydrogenase YdfG